MRAAKVPLKELRRVVVAASVGNIIEWYDFYIFGSLAAILAVKFFEKGHPVAAFLSTVAIFSVGFLIRPLGAFVFGWLGDKVGRKYTFIVTLTGMGLATALIGFVPTYKSIGLAAAFILFALRLIQGLCLGGESGGAITYVAEHIEDEHRGYYTGWLKTSPTLGSVVVLGQGCVWYSGQFWALFYLQSVKKLDVLTSSWIIALALLIATPTLIFWGWLSDKIGRKPIILGGMALAALTYYPLYSALGVYGDPKTLNITMAVIIVAILVNYVGMTYGPIGAFLAEFFPGRIRYTSVSVPYHIGNGWGGGLVPIVTTAAYAKAVEAGSSNPLFWALLYPIGIPTIMFLISVFTMPETRKHSIWEEGAIEATRAKAKARPGPH